MDFFFLWVIMEVNQNPMRNKSDDKPETCFERSSESRRQHGQMILPSLQNTKRPAALAVPLSLDYFFVASSAEAAKSKIVFPEAENIASWEAGRAFRSRERRNQKTCNVPTNKMCPHESVI